MSASVRFPAVLDHAVFTELGAALPREKIRELVWLFVAETEFYLTEIASRRAAGDLESVARLAHNIVSVAGNLGAMRASALARQLERACRGGDKTYSYHLISELSQACQDASAQMHDWLTDAPGLLHTA
jgi:HPt (histidine-containing phosphotransfer) domain-containing protein